MSEPLTCRDCGIADARVQRYPDHAWQPRTLRSPGSDVASHITWSECIDALRAALAERDAALDEIDELVPPAIGIYQTIPDRVRLVIAQRDEYLENRNLVHAEYLRLYTELAEARAVMAAVTHPSTSDAPDACYVPDVFQSTGTSASACSRGTLGCNRYHQYHHRPLR